MWKNIQKNIKQGTCTWINYNNKTIGAFEFDTIVPQYWINEHWTSLVEDEFTNR